MEKARANISGRMIGVVLVAKDDSGNEKTFQGCNIEVSTSFVVHAERVALLKAISEGYIEPLELHLIANNEESCAALCGYCRQDYMYVNPNLSIYVYHPNGKLKLATILCDLMKFPYQGIGRL